MEPVARRLKVGDALWVVWRPEQPRDVNQQAQGAMGAGGSVTADGRRTVRERRGTSEWWRQGTLPNPVVYDCTVMQVVSSCPKATVVKARMLKPDRGLLADEQQLALTIDAPARSNSKEPLVARLRSAPASPPS